MKDLFTHQNLSNGHQNMEDMSSEYGDMVWYMVWYNLLKNLLIRSWRSILEVTAKGYHYQQSWRSVELEGVLNFVSCSKNHKTDEVLNQIGHRQSVHQKLKGNIFEAAPVLKYLRFCISDLTLGSVHHGCVFDIIESRIYALSHKW
jgi:hypothetical protein